MDIQDIIFSHDVPTALKQDIIGMLDDIGNLDPYLKVLVPTATNDDVNGSQHAHNGGNDFTYQDATLDDVQSATSAGVYDYFSEEGSHYTGHYYNGSDRKFQAIVFNPPAYAATHHF